jgi:hypothetical protein
MHQDGCHRGTDNEPTKVGSPINARGKKANNDVNPK